MFASGFTIPRLMSASAPRPLGLAILAIVLFSSLAFGGHAEARSRHHRGKEFVPTSASFVMDAYSGRVLYSRNADTQCYPASLTKVMTLYLLFERMRDGRISLKTQIPVSAHAANQAPSRLGLRHGETITVEDAIKAIVTKSANDVAVALGEYMGGSEKDFARIMTAKARALGMKRTQYMNASGLPNRGQLTTARDQALLAQHIQKDFPQYFPYFSTAEFEWDGRVIRNHNHLLGKYEGVNGLKTGYTAASGFNLTTTVMRDDKSVIGVVLGGKTARARDQQMVSILDDAMPKAVAMRDTGTRLASAVPVRKPAGISNRDRVALAALASEDEPDPDEESYTGTDKVASLTASEPEAPAVPIAAPAPVTMKPIAEEVAQPVAAPAAVPVVAPTVVAVVPALRPATSPQQVADNRPAQAAAPIDSRSEESRVGEEGRSQ